MAFDKILKLDETCGVAYVLMANIFASAGLLEDAKKVESLKLEYSSSH